MSSFRSKIIFILSAMIIAAGSAQAYTLICWGSESGCKSACAKLGGSWTDRGNYSRCNVATAAPRPSGLDSREAWQFSCDAAAGAQCAQSCKAAKGDWNQGKNVCTSTSAKTRSLPADAGADIGPTGAQQARQDDCRSTTADCKPRSNSAKSGGSSTSQK